MKHKFSNDFKKYPHSSYLSYMSEKVSNIKRDYILELFGGKDNFEFCNKESQIKYEGVIAEIDLMDE